MTHNTINNIEAKGISKRAVETEKKYLFFGAKEVIMSSIFIRREFKLLRIIRQANDH